MAKKLTPKEVERLQELKDKQAEGVVNINVALTPEEAEELEELLEKEEKMTSEEV